MGRYQDALPQQGRSLYREDERPKGIKETVQAPGWVVRRESVLGLHHIRGLGHLTIARMAIPLHGFLSQGRTCHGRVLDGLGIATGVVGAALVPVLVQ